MNSKILYLPLAAAAMNVSAADAAKSEKPNILLIMADDMGYECLGANGSTYKTPNLDKMAEQSMLFANCHAQPLSTPTRVQLMTGKYNNRNYTKFAQLDPSQKSFGNAAKEAGYTTCIAGKWQLGKKTSLPAHFGFDKYCLWQLTQPKSQGERYASAVYEKDGGAPIKMDMDGYGPDIFVNYICDFIEENKESPMFIYYPMVLIHDPFTPTPDSREWKDREKRTSGKGRGTKMVSDMVTYADKNVGILLEKLKECGLSDNTLVVFLGDNGTNHAVNTPMQDGSMYRGGKRGTLRNGTHVPLIASWPGVIKSSKNTNMVDSSDFYPTLCEAMGVDCTGEKLDGISFYKQLVGEKSEKVREWSFCHYPNQGKPGNYTRFAQTADYKLYSTGRFYNTRKDAEELKNLVKGKASKAEEVIRQTLQSVLDSYPAGSEVVTKNILDVTK